MKSYQPFLLSLALEQLSIRAGRNRHFSGSDLERDERARRQRQLWKYLFRGPAWELITKSVSLHYSESTKVLMICFRPRLDALCARLDRWPLLNIASSVAQSYKPLVEELYYYTS